LSDSGATYRALGAVSLALDVTAGAVAPDGRTIILGDAAGGVHFVRLDL
jgi:hypothetical protein